MTSKLSGTGEDPRYLQPSTKEMFRIGSWMSVPKTGMVHFSDEMYRILKLDPARPEPDLETSWGLIHPDDREFAEGSIQRQVAAGEPWCLKYRLVCADGTVKQVVSRGMAELDDRGDPLRLVGTVVHNVSNLERRQLVGHVPRDVSATLREWERRDEGMTDLLGRLGVTLGWSVGSFWTREEDLEDLRCRDFWHAPGVAAKELEQLTRSIGFEPGIGLAGEAWSKCKPIAAKGTTRAGGPVRRHALETLGMRLGVAFPIVNDGDVIAVCECFFAGRWSLTPTETAMLGAIGAKVGSLFARRFVWV
jgi:hypothetical protein